MMLKNQIIICIHDFREIDQFAIDEEDTQILIYVNDNLYDYQCSDCPIKLRDIDWLLNYTPKKNVEM